MYDVIVYHNMWHEHENICNNNILMKMKVLYEFEYRENRQEMATGVGCGATSEYISILNSIKILVSSIEYFPHEYELSKMILILYSTYYIGIGYSVIVHCETILFLRECHMRLSLALA